MILAELGIIFAYLDSTIPFMKDFIYSLRTNNFLNQKLNKVKVKLHTRLRSVIGKDEIDVEMTTSPNIRSLLKHLSEGYPKLKPLLEGEFGYKHLMVAINNNHVGFLTEQVLEKQINDNDLVTIAEPSAAG